jgi:hypothetical protein
VLSAGAGAFVSSGGVTSGMAVGDPGAIDVVSGGGTAFDVALGRWRHAEGAQRCHQPRHDHQCQRL